MSQIESVSKMHIVPDPMLQDYAADPDDNKFVDCAVAGNAKYIVTEDSHYDVLKGLDFPKVDIIKLDESSRNCKLHEVSDTL